MKLGLSAFLSNWTLQGQLLWRAAGKN